MHIDLRTIDLNTQNDVFTEHGLVRMSEFEIRFFYKRWNHTPVTHLRLLNQALVLRPVQSSVAHVQLNFTIDETKNNTVSRLTVERGSASKQTATRQIKPVRLCYCN